MSSRRLVSFLSALCITILLQNAQSRLVAEEIVGGDLAREGQFPYQVFLHHANDVNSIRCGGAIHSKDHILTAAHCVMDIDGFSEQILKVKVGIIAGNQCTDSYEVHTIYTPWQYTPKSRTGKPSVTYDVAVLKLSQSLDLSPQSKLRAVKLPEPDLVPNPVTKEIQMLYQTYAGQRAILTGYGWNVVDNVSVELINDKNVSTEDGGTDQQLRYAKVKILSIEKCGKFTRMETSRMICAQMTQRDNMKRGACSADSGSPLVIDNTVVGVLSASPTGCREIKSPAKYARVTKLLPFIKNAMNETVDETKLRVSEINVAYKMTDESKSSEMAKKYWNPPEY